MGGKSNPSGPASGVRSGPAPAFTRSSGHDVQRRAQALLQIAHFGCAAAVGEPWSRSVNSAPAQDQRDGHRRHQLHDGEAAARAAPGAVHGALLRRSVATDDRRARRRRVVHGDDDAAAPRRAGPRRSPPARVEPGASTWRGRTGPDSPRSRRCRWRACPPASTPIDPRPRSSSSLLPGQPRGHAGVARGAGRRGPNRRRAAERRHAHHSDRADRDITSESPPASSTKREHAVLVVAVETCRLVLQADRKPLRHCGRWHARNARPRGDSHDENARSAETASAAG